jgi:XTP/dITP diphosphohydrolase
VKIVFATSNENKTREISNLLGNSFTLINLTELNITEEIPEDEPTLEGNALFKARFIYNATGMNVFADDTGLEIEELDGRPGVHSARFAGEEKDSQANIDKVLKLMKNSKHRKAKFRTIIALVLDAKEYVFEGVVNGNITRERHGSAGFGYDPIFIPENHDRTFAEMTIDEKNKISHRARAFNKLKQFLFQIVIPDNKRIN